jgi:hypothetical protein
MAMNGILDQPVMVRVVHNETINEISFMCVYAMARNENGFYLQSTDKETMKKAQQYAKSGE